MALIGMKSRLKATVDLTCALTSLNEDRLLGFDSERYISGARKLACWAAHRILQVSLPQIAEHFGDRDHTTVLYLIRDMDQLVANDPASAHRAGALRRELNEWSRRRRRDPTCQTGAFCARLRTLHGALSPKPNGKHRLTEQTWYDRDGAMTTPVKTFTRQNDAFAAAMRAEIVRINEEAKGGK